MAQEHSHDHAYLHEHNIPHLHHETDVHDADHNHEHAHSHDHASGVPDGWLWIRISCVASNSSARLTISR